MHISYDKAVDLAPDKMKAWIVSEVGCELTQASQVCNDIISHPGDEAGAGGWTKYTVLLDGKAHRVYHASAGIEGTPKTCTVFFVEYPAKSDMCLVVALGQHIGSSTYSIKY